VATAATDGRLVGEYVSIVTDETTLGANTCRGICFRVWGDITGGRSAGCEWPLRETRETATVETVSEADLTLVGP
jgi:uncharacterized protein YbjQ (UPF0145 family)